MLINMVLPGAVETARLPKEYQEVEYLRSDGGQHIELDYIPNQNTKVKIDFKATNTDCAIFGSRIDYNNAAFTLYWSKTNAAAIEIGSSFYSLGSLADSNRHLVEMSNTAFIMDGSTVHTYSTGSFKPNAKFRLFHSGGADSLAKMQGDIYSCEISEGDTLMCCPVACYRKADNEAGVYDIVNKVFYTNAGTSSFIVGPPVDNAPSSGESLEFSYSGNYTDNRINGKGTVRLNTSGTLTVLSGKATVQAYILGAGGGGAFSANASELLFGYGSSGGGGGIQTINVELAAGTYEVIIGTGGISATAHDATKVTGGTGGNTTAFGYTSTGGTGGMSWKYNNSWSVGIGGSPDGGNGSYVQGNNVAAGGSPNGGSVANYTPQNGGDGYVELTFI